LPCDVACAHAMLGDKMACPVIDHTGLGHIDYRSVS